VEDKQIIQNATATAATNLEIPFTTIRTQIRGPKFSWPSHIGEPIFLALRFELPQNLEAQPFWPSKLIVPGITIEASTFKWVGLI
jgi:hypothetical protein